MAARRDDPPSGIYQAIEASGGNAMRTARMLGISHRKLQRWRARFAPLEKAFELARQSRPTVSLEALLQTLQQQPKGSLRLRWDPTGWTCQIGKRSAAHANPTIALLNVIIQEKCNDTRAGSEEGSTDL